MGKLVDQYIEIAKKRNPGEPEFIQTVEEVLTSIEPVLEAHPEYVEAGLIERLIEPERGISFRVPWVDDEGKVQVNRGYRYEFNSAIGPYKGGLRFAANVYPGIIKFLGFEQIFKNSLTGLPIGGGKGGSDFDPTGKSDAEVMRFCQSFMTELYRHIGPHTDVPAGDMGVGAREIGYLFGQYKRLSNRYEGVLTGKGLAYGGLAGRTEATGYGIVFFAREMLKHCGEELAGKTVAVSGFGNVTWGTVQKLNQLGAKVITISGPDGYIYDPDGVTPGEKEDYLLELRASGKNICAPYADKFPGATFYAGKKPWEVKADLYIPCATQNEIRIEDAKTMVANGCKFLCEGANMPTTNEAIEYLQENGVIVGPSKAANAGGVACSCIEMGQNAGHTVFSPAQVYEQLETIMVNIHKNAAAACEKYGLGYDLIKGANIAGFEKVAEAMMAQGIV
ncbi:NADP-specific glutamate dehydrogenase [Anaerovoracaceae bacterium 41-7]|jgi:glutamate dehydrogenase (NADP+)|uniref:Glutamate dehydrogenase n=1 Tax=Anaerotruncus colihominis TaxID=169435 RepID=A0A845QI37_9FIRM|nr:MULTISPECIES: NADP-specific glutamate dehydrogenase [Clostridia]MCI9476045.1 NADP-specific glutamate dehydrogenase [Emergencia sp.]MCI9639073.1 NADP-specific glutamate dehydrogenase [Emergencia sp.]NBH60433.1 NADP-specific glutamate dehydrogenase [Anaerotruncus colihominis]NCE99227.1 NADP-specific glutamate dehydrogenase [Emergencia sp. 1XD21-10]NCF01087.1 NADP-specific glutamate dehydrogenase [Anaerotruncus sp. 80]